MVDDSVVDFEGFMAREPKGNLGEAVAKRTYLRLLFKEPPNEMPVRLNKHGEHFRKWLVACVNSNVPYVLDDESDVCDIEPETVYETWADVAKRVSEGNVSLAPEGPLSYGADKLRWRIANASILMSGRHLAHGDSNQINKEQTVFTNCSTSAFSSVMFYLLLCGSGVGRDYSDHMMLFNYATDMPKVVVALSKDHPDFDKMPEGVIPRDEANELYPDSGDGRVSWFAVPDSREGWGKSLEVVEIASFENNLAGRKVHEVVVIDLTPIRGEGEPILGVGGAPASGPAPIAQAFISMMNEVYGKDMPAWKACMYVDHFFASCVLVGGVRRASRIALKYWKDKDILDFVDIKRPLEFIGKTGEEILQIRKNGAPMSNLWTSNNSVIVTSDFYDALEADGETDAKRLFNHVMHCQFYDGTGEPAFVNADLIENTFGEEVEFDDDASYKVSPTIRTMMKVIKNQMRNMPYYSIVNPCGEIPLFSLMGFCVVGDILPYFTSNFNDVIEDSKILATALLRTNLMNSIYNSEVRRTNRIGVSMTGFHEFMHDKFDIIMEDVIRFSPERYLERVGGRVIDVDLIDDLSRDNDKNIRVGAFLDFVGLTCRETVKHVYEVCDEAGLVRPHTVMTVKPSGTISKIFGVSEGAHVPDMLYYLRWTQFRDTDPKVEEYREMGYPVRYLETYKGHAIVGFPTRSTMAELRGNRFKVASSYSPEDHFKWSSILTFFWLEGGTVMEWVEMEGDFHKLVEKRGGTYYGGQVSYTMTIDIDDMSFEDYSDLVRSNIRNTRCITMLPHSDTNDMAYEYMPNESVSKNQYDEIIERVKYMELMKHTHVQEDVNREHVECAGGACPIDFSEVA